MKVTKFFSVTFSILILSSSVCFSQLQYQPYPRAMENVIQVENLRDILFELTSPAFEGRELGTEGNIKVTDWLTFTFQKNNLRPIPSLGQFTQSFPIHRLEIDTTYLSVDNQPLILFQDFTISKYSGNAEGKLQTSDADTYFLDVSETVDVYSKLRELQQDNYKLVFLYNSKLDELEATYRFEDKIELPLRAQKSMQNTSQPFISANRVRIPVFHINPELASNLAKNPGSDINFKIKLEMLQSRTASNVIGYFGPDLDDEYNTPFILVTSYFDQEGLHPVTGIPFFGAVDNASGMAAVLESQRMLELVASRLRHPIVWVALNGNNREQSGLRYFYETNTMFWNQCIVHIDVSAIAGSSSDSHPTKLYSNLDESVIENISSIGEYYDLEIIYNYENNRSPYIAIKGDEYPYHNRILDSSDKVNLGQLYNQTLYLNELIWIFSNLFNNRF